MKRAFTLIELVVYIAIMGFIIIVAGRVFSDSTSMRVRTQNMVKATEELNKVVAIIKEDISQMGAKTYKISQTTKTEERKDTIKGVYVGYAGANELLLNENVYIKKDEPNKDFSSFDLRHRYHTDASGKEKNNDSIGFKKNLLDANGKNMGVRLISWELKADTLYRRCATINKTNYVAADDEDASICVKDNLNDATPIAMANNIQAFRLLPSRPGNPNVVDWRFPANPSPDNLSFKLINEGTGKADIPSCIIDNITYKSINMVTLRNFARNEGNTTKHNELYVADPDANVDNYQACHKFNFKVGETYSIKFKTPPIDNKIDTLMTLFQPDKDHISIGFRKANTERYTDVDGLKTDFMFYVPQTKDYDVNSINHYFEFSVQTEVQNACAVFTFAFYGPKANIGKLAIQDFEIWQKPKAYHFTDDGGYYTKRYATKEDDKSPSENLKNKKSVKAFELQLEIKKGKSDGGEVISNLSTISTPNNGIEAGEVL